MIAFDDGIFADCHGDSPNRFPALEVKLARGAGVIGTRIGRAVAGGEIDRGKPVKLRTTRIVTEPSPSLTE